MSKGKKAAKLQQGLEVIFTNPQKAEGELVELRAHFFPSPALSAPLSADDRIGLFSECMLNGATIKGKDWRYLAAVLYASVSDRTLS